MLRMVCPIDLLRVPKSDDTYGGVSHTTMVSEEMVHGFSCEWNQSAFVVYMMEKGLTICQFLHIYFIKEKLIQWESTIPSISTKLKIISHLE